jgi:endoglucanase
MIERRLGHPSWSEHILGERRTWVMSVAAVALATSCGTSTDSNAVIPGGGAQDAGQIGCGPSQALCNGGACSMTCASGQSCANGICVGGTGGTGAGGATGGAATGGAANSGQGTGGMDVGAGLTASEAAAAMGKGFNLGQMFESTQHPRTLAKASAKVDAYYDRGFRNVRIPITWTESVGGDTLVNDSNVGDLNRSHARLAVIEQVVDYALSKPDLYVVINAHHEARLKTENRSWVLERLWQDIAEVFGNRDHRLLYEILNEPHRSDSTAMPPEDLRSMTGLAYASVRAVDPERIIVIGGNQWFSAPEMATVWPQLDEVGGGRDPYLMATFHHYDPWTFCGDNQGTYDDPWNDNNLSNPMDTMLAWADSVGNGMPVYIGEWGVGWASTHDWMDCNNIRAWYQGMHSQFASAKGIPTSVWDDGGWFKIFDHGSDAFDNNLVDCIVGTCDWTGSDRFNDGCQ